jgi:tetratricopeptide (TPR) repeat protein
MRVVLKLEPTGANPTAVGGEVALSNNLATSAALASALDIPEETDPATLYLEIAAYRVRRDESATQLDDAVDEADRLAHNAIASAFTQATDLYNGGRLDDALAAFERSEQMLRNDNGPRRVLVLLSLADIERSRNNGDAAVGWLDRALAIAPTHRGALEARITLAQERGESSLVAALLKRLVPRLDSSDRKVEALQTIAEQSLLTAREAIAQASELMPSSIELLERLRAVNEAAGMWAEAVSALVQIAEHTESPRQRAKVLVDAARLCSERAHHTPRAVALYEAAIEDDPQLAGAFEAMEAELIRANDAAGLAAAYTRQIARLQAHGATEEQVPILRHLARIQQEALSDRAAAIGSLEQVLKLQPSDVSARQELARLYEGAGDAGRAIDYLEGVVLRDPTQVEAYRTLLKLFNEAGSIDRSFCASSVLVALGEANTEEQQVFGQYRPETLPVAKSTLDDESWLQLLPDAHTRVLDQVATAVENVAFDIWYGDGKRSVSPPGGEKVNPQKTTVSAARCFTWAAHLLGLPEPEIYLQPTQTRIGMRILPRRQLSIELGHPVLSGWSMGELAFLAAHHLTYARPGWRIIALLGSRDEVRSLLMGGLAVARPDVPGLAEIGSRAQEFAGQLQERMSSETRELLGGIVERLLSGEETLEVFAWLRTVEETASRAGLLASGNVTVAANVLAVAGTTPGGQSAAERAKALLAFCVSKRHAELRSTLGVQVG